MNVPIWPTLSGRPSVAEVPRFILSASHEQLGAAKAYVGGAPEVMNLGAGPKPYRSSVTAMYLHCKYIEVD